MEDKKLDGIFPVLSEKQKDGLGKLFEANLDNQFESMGENKVYENHLTDILHEADMVLRKEYKRMRNEFLTITPLVTEDAEYEIVEPNKAFDENVLDFINVGDDLRKAVYNAHSLDVYNGFKELVEPIKIDNNKTEQK